MTFRSLAIAALASIGLISCSSVSGSEEMPNYTVLQADDAFEVRSYAPQLYAEVTATGTRDEASGKAFRQLAAYIFDDERPEGGIAMTAPVVQQPSREKIAMTAPVVQEQGAENEWTMAFSMPEKWTLATLPKPENPNITLREEPAAKLATVEFSGRAGDAMLAEKEGELRAWMRERGLVATGPATYAFYDAPWVIGPLRRNEVQIPVQ